MGYKDDYTLEHRKNESSKILERYPDRIPIICETLDKKAPKLDKKKFLVPCDLTMGQFMFILRKRINLKQEEAIYLFVNNTICPSSALMSSIYDKNIDEDGFLYIKYNGESTFG
jgi:GABA(A) receptor-associated protein